MWWEILIGVGVGLLAAWLALVIALLLIRPRGLVSGWLGSQRHWLACRRLVRGDAGVRG